MERFIDNLKDRFKQKDLLIQLIIINIAVFALISIFKMVLTLLDFGEEVVNAHLESVLRYIGVPADIPSLLRVWTLFTYMFVHADILHILFNMLLLYWFGQMFLSFFNPKILGSLYVLGGLAGAVFYILAFNTVPLYLKSENSYMIGASASVMAIIFGVAFYRPQMSMRLLLIGEVKIVYIAIFFFIMDFFALGSASNAGGHVAHIGGAAVGYLFAVQYAKGKDITRWITRIIDTFANFSFKRKKPKMNVKFKKREEEYQFNERKHLQQDQIDDILDKVKASGYSSLSKDEKKLLFEASKK